MAKFEGFIGSAYTTRSVNFDCQRTVNLYPVSSEVGDSKNINGLQGTPGLETFVTLPESPSRGSHEVLGRAFCVNGGSLYEIFSDGTYTLLGALLTSNGSVSMADNGFQVVMVDGPNGYILTLADNTFAQITSSGWMGADTVTYVDGYFVFNKPDTGIYYITALYDGFDIDALDFASAEGAPDNLVAVMAVHRQVWLLGTASVEVVFNSGAADFPFERIQGTFIEYGCAAAFSVAKTANTIFWLGQDEQGSGVIWMATGYQPQRISTFAIEYLLQQSVDLSGATAYTYQEDGHYFYVLNLIDLDTTVVYDINLGEWHERAYLDLSTGTYTRHRGQTHMYAFEKHLVGDYDSGIIYNQSLNIYDDNGNPKRWMRTCAHIADNENLEYIYYNRFQIDMETGVGLESGNDEDTDPQVMLSWSDDGGHVWSSERWVSAGMAGQYSKRALWRRLGRSRDRVFKVAGTSATKVFLISANMNIVMGMN